METKSNDSDKNMRIEKRWGIIRFVLSLLSLLAISPLVFLIFFWHTNDASLDGPYITIMLCSLLISAVLGFTASIWNIVATVANGKKELHIAGLVMSILASVIVLLFFVGSFPI